MKADCHMHMVLDGVDWKASIGRGICDGFIRDVLKTYQDLGYTYLRDGGDRFGVGARARALAPEYDIQYRTPLSPLCKEGCYGSFIGTPWHDLSHYAQLVKTQKAAGADFIKIMISGLMDFSQFGVLTQESLPAKEIFELVHIVHEEGLSVMAHCNGTDAAIAAAGAKIDSIEHGAYLHKEALCAMEENGTIWCPTVSTVGNLMGKGRFPDREIIKILDSFLENIDAYKGCLAPGSDAGAWAVPHGCDTEDTWLKKAGVTNQRLQDGVRAVMHRF